MGKYSNYTKYGRSLQAEENDRVTIDSTQMYRTQKGPEVTKFGGTFEELFKKASERKTKQL